MADDGFTRSEHRGVVILTPNSPRPPIFSGGQADAPAERPAESPLRPRDAIFSDSTPVDVATEPKRAAMYEKSAEITAQMHEALDRRDHLRAQRLQHERHALHEEIGRMERGEAGQAEDKPKPVPAKAEPKPTQDPEPTMQPAEAAEAFSGLLDVPFEGGRLGDEPAIAESVDRFLRYAGDVTSDGTRDLGAAREWVRGSPGLIEAFETIEVDGVALGDHPAVVEMMAYLGGVIAQANRNLGI